MQTILILRLAPIWQIN